MSRVISSLDVPNDPVKYGEGHDRAFGTPRKRKWTMPAAMQPYAGFMGTDVEEIETLMSEYGQEAANIMHTDAGRQIEANVKVGLMAELIGAGMLKPVVCALEECDG